MPAGDYEIRVLTRFDASGFQSYINEIKQGLASLATAGGASPARAQSTVSEARAAAEASRQQLQKYGRVDPKVFQGLNQQLELAFQKVIGDINRTLAGASRRGRVADPMARNSTAGVRASYDEQMGLYVPNATRARQDWARVERQRQARAARAQRQSEEDQEREQRRQRTESVKATRGANQGLQEYQRDAYRRSHGLTGRFQEFDANAEAQRRRDAQIQRGYLQRATTPLDIQRRGYLDAGEAHQRAQRQGWQYQAAGEMGTPELQGANQIRQELLRAREAVARIAAIGNVDITGGEQAYYEALGQAAAAKREESARTRATTAQALAGSQTYAQAGAQAQIAQQRQAINQRVAVLHEQLALSQEDLVEQRKLVAQEAALARALQQRVASADQSIGRGGTVWQRGMAAVRAHRYGGGGGGGAGGALGAAGAEAEQTGAQFLGRHAMNTMGYALPGLALYGAITQFRSMVEESIEFGQQMSGVQTQLQAMGQGQQFAAMTQNIMSVSNATGATSVEVATLSQEFLGLYQNVGQANQATAQAAGYLEAIGANVQETAPAMRAGAGAYNITPAVLSNYAESLRQQTGIAPFGKETGAQSLQFFADMAPTASMFNLGAQQVQNIGVAALRYSAQSPENVSTSLARILPDLASAKGVAQLGNLGYNFNQAASGGNVIAILQNMLQQTGSGRGQVPASALKASGLFSERDFQTLEDLFGHPQQALAALGQNSVNPNLAKNRTDAYMQTPGGRLHQFEQEIRNFGIALVNAGVGRVFSDVATAATKAGAVIRPVAHWFEDVNQSMAGIPGTLLGVVAALAIFKKAWDIGSSIKKTGTDIRTVLHGQAAKTASTDEGVLAEAQKVQARAARDAAVAESELTIAQKAERGGGGLSGLGKTAAKDAESEAGQLGRVARLRGVAGQFFGGMGLRSILGAARGGGIVGGAEGMRGIFGIGGAGVGMGEGTLLGGGAAGIGTVLGGVGLAAGAGTAIGLAISRSGLGHWFENNAGRGTGAGIAASILDPAAAVGAMFGGHAATPRGAADVQHYQGGRHAVAGHADWVQGRMGFFDSSGKYTAWAPGQQGNVAAAQAYARAHRNAARAVGANTQAVGQMVASLADPSTDMQVLQQQFETGTISWQAFTQQMQTNVARLESIAKNRPNDVQAQQQALQAVQQQQQALDAMAQAQATANQNLVNTTTGNVSTGGGLAAAQQKQAAVLRQAVMEANSQSQQQQTGAAFIQGLQQQLSAAVGAALNPAQAEAIANAGQVITPEDEQAIQRYYKALGEAVPAGLQAGQKITLDPAQQVQLAQQASEYQQQMDESTAALQASQNPGQAVANAMTSYHGYLKAASDRLTELRNSGMSEDQAKQDNQYIQDINSAQQSFNQAAQAWVQAYSQQAQIMSAQSFGDAVVAGAAAMNAAHEGAQKLMSMGYAWTSSDVQQQVAAYYQGYQQLVEGQAQQAAGLAQLSEAQSPYNQAQKARTDLKTAKDDIARYTPIAEQLVKMGYISSVQDFPQLVAAQTAAANAVKEQVDYQMTLNSSQASLAQAHQNLLGNRAAGDQAQIQALRQNLALMVANHADQATLNNLQAQITQAQDQYAQDLISQTQTRVQNELSLQQISIGQAVAQLQALEGVATSQQERQALQVQIRQLMQQATSQADLGVPTGGFMPTLYEVRRLAAMGGQFGASAPPGSNLTAPVQNNYVMIQVNNPSDMAGAVSAFANVLSQSPTQSGTRVGVTSP